MDKIYYVRDGQQAGPFTEAEIRAQVAAGTVNGNTMVWWEGLPEWMPLARTPLAQSGAPIPTPDPLPMPAAFEGPPMGTRNSNLATISLVTGLLGAIGGLPAFCCGLFGAFCGILGLVAVITGHMARAEIRKDPTISGAGFALAGLILGYIAILFAAIIVALTITFIALNPALKEMFSTIQSQLNAAAASR